MNSSLKSCSGILDYYITTSTSFNIFRREKPPRESIKKSFMSPRGLRVQRRLGVRRTMADTMPR